MGRSRRDLRALDDQYLLNVPSNTNIRDIEVALPTYSGRGRHPKHPFQRVDAWIASLAKETWTPINVRDGEKGPRVLEIVKRRVVARTERRCRDRTKELLVATRRLDENGKTKVDYHLSNASPDTPVGGIVPCGQNRTSYRGLSQAIQERGRPFGLQSTYLGGLVSSSNAFSYRHMVFDKRNTSGKKNIRRR